MGACFHARGRAAACALTLEFSFFSKRFKIMEMQTLNHRSRRKRPGKLSGRLRFHVNPFELSQSFANGSGYRPPSWAPRNRRACAQGGCLRGQLSSHHLSDPGGQMGTSGTPSLGQGQLVGCRCPVRWTPEVPLLNLFAGHCPQCPGVACWITHSRGSRSVDRDGTVCAPSVGNEGGWQASYPTGSRPRTGVRAPSLQ